MMSALWLLGHKTLSDPLTVQEALSGIFGSISLATWIFLLVSAFVACGGCGFEDILQWIAEQG